MYYIYVLVSVERKYRYIGITDNIERRVSQHNNGYNRTTKPYAPFLLVLSEQYQNRETAREREKWLKSGVGREWLNKLI